MPSPHPTHYLLFVSSRGQCASAPSTFRELAAKVEDVKAKDGIMTIAEQLKQEGWERGREEGWQEGRQEGRQEGTLMGQIQTCQELLNLPVSGLEELAQKSAEELELLLQELKTRLRSHLRI